MKAKIEFEIEDTEDTNETKLKLIQENTILIIGLMIKLLIDIIFGLTISFAIMVVVYPFTFMYQILKQHFFNIKDIVSK